MKVTDNFTEQMPLQQVYSDYTEIDQQIWSTLYKRQMGVISEVASSLFYNGVHLLKFSENAIPDFNEINLHLKAATGWVIYAVPCLIPNDLFFHRMASQEFGATCWLRKPEQLDYLEEPDMFHDVFGHVPLLADKNVSRYLADLAGIAIQNLDNENVIEWISRLYWYTIEFGLIKENGELKIYGAGILSSIGETKFCLSPEANHVPFDTNKILQTPYIKDKFQEQYFVLESTSDLNRAIDELKEFLLTNQ